MTMSTETSTAKEVQKLPWGLLAEFPDPESLIAASERLRAAGHLSLDAFVPFPIEGLSSSLGFKRSPMPWIILIGGIIGGTSTYFLEYWVNFYAYPINVGGRPLHSWPSFIPPAFEGTVMISSLFALIGLILICGLPRIHHPVFEIEAFKRASTDGFFLAIKTEDDSFDPTPLTTLLNELGASDVWEVPHE